MEISRKSWHYQLYKFSYFGHVLDNRSWVIPRKTNSCNYWARVILYPIPMSIIYAIAITLAIVLVVSSFILGNFFTIIKGQGVGLLSNHLDEIINIKYHFPDVRIGKRYFKFKDILYYCYGIFGSYFLLSTFPVEMFTLFKWIVVIVIFGYLLYGVNFSIKKIKKACCFNVDFVESEEEETATQKVTSA